MTQDFKIPEKHEVTLYTHICLESEYSFCIGQINTTIYKPNERESVYAILDERNLVIDLSGKKIEGKKLVVDHLEKKKQDELASHHMKMKELQDKIDSLLAITYEGDETNDT